MTQDDFFDLSPEESFDSFDPLYEADSDFEIEDYDAPLESGIVRTDPAEFPDMEQLAQRSEEIAQMPACMRIETLFDNMPTHHRLLLAVLGQCQEPCSNEALVQFITEWQVNQKSIFGPETIIQHMERAGAITRQTEDGTAFDQLDLSPKTVIIDGVEFLEPCNPPAIFWAITPDGKDVLDRNQPDRAVRELIKDEPQYRHIYKIVLEAASAEDGTSEKELGPQVNGDPALQKPRMYVPRFFDRLSDHEALVWSDRKWRATERGKALLEFIAELDETDPVSQPEIQDAE